VIKFLTGVLLPVIMRFNEWSEAKKVFPIFLASSFHIDVGVVVGNNQQEK
jgi:hypothetical protein